MTFPYKTMTSVDFLNKRAVVRVDLNVPIQNGIVSDSTRIDRVIPTLRYLIEKGAKLVILSHFDRPKGKVVPEMSLAPIAKALEAALSYPVKFIATDWLDSAPETAIAAMNTGDVILLENTRFAAGEENNDNDLACKMQNLGDVFVMDAFSCAHRAHASTSGIATCINIVGDVLRRIPCVAGLACEGELRALNAALESPKHPSMAIVGGAKVSTKISLLANLVERVDYLVIGGGMANTFLAAQGFNVGKSLCENSYFDTANNLQEIARKNGCKILLPLDVIVAAEFKAHARNYACNLDSVPADMMILDIGPKTITHLEAVLHNISTVLWNGPFGAFEMDPFNKGTNAVARAVAKLTKAGKMQSIAGGGDTVSALNGANIAEDFTYISTAGGAFLEMIEGSQLPGVEVLRLA